MQGILCTIRAKRKLRKGKQKKEEWNQNKDTGESNEGAR
jgi:hypothetical protein